jgi:hypothetical protein
VNSHTVLVDIKQAVGNFLNKGSGMVNRLILVDSMKKFNQRDLARKKVIFIDYTGKGTNCITENFKLFRVATEVTSNNRTILKQDVTDRGRMHDKVL